MAGFLRDYLCVLAHDAGYFIRAFCCTPPSAVSVFGILIEFSLGNYRSAVDLEMCLKLVFISPSTAELGSPLAPKLVRTDLVKIDGKVRLQKKLHRQLGELFSPVYTEVFFLRR